MKPSVTSKLAVVLSMICLAGQTGRADTTLVFNEIMYHPATNEPAMEWVELHNQYAVDLDVSGWSITGGIDFHFPTSTVVRGRSYVVVALSAPDLIAATGITNIIGSYTGRLSNAGEELNLREINGRIVDSVNYGVEGRWPVAPDGSGVSLAKRDRDLGSAAPENWTWSEQIGGTPGAENFPVPSETRLIAVDAVWKYEASGADLGTAWRNLNYNDGSWASRSNLSQQSISTLFNTGVGANRAVLAAGVADPHYILTVNANGPVPTNATVMTPNAAWAPADPSSAWIGVTSSGNTTINGGAYNFQTTFSLANYLLNSVQVNFSAAIDNALTDVFLNGSSKGLSVVGFAGFNPPFTISSGFAQVTNVLEFRTTNEGAGPGGFRAVVSGSGLVANTNSPLPTGRTTYYFRRTFVSPLDPAYVQLRLNPVISDGAVVYLNGTEIYRQNMPPGPVNYSTPAVTNVPSPGYNGFTTVPAASLLEGTNVLAVEIHQELTTQDDPLLGLDLVAVPFAPPPLTIAFNEITAATNLFLFWVELMNYGSNAISLDGYILYRDGPGNTNSAYVFPPGSTLGVGAFLALTNTQLGFRALDEDRLFLYTPNYASIADAAVVKNRHRGRSPDGTGRWLYPSQRTPGGPNVFAFHNEIVINEIMYHHALLPNGEESPEEWIELYNRGNQTVDLTGWEIEGGVDFTFAPGTSIAPSGYLVVADDAAYLRGLYPSIPIVGNLGGGLSGKTDEIILRDPMGNPADEVRYFDGGRWPGYADGGGSSLELRDPDADNSKAEAWAASDESSKSGWQTYTYRMVANVPGGSGQPAQWNDFILGLLSAGECLVDDISVLETNTQFIANGNFESGLTGWRVLGTHNRSRVITDPENTGNHVLHVVATAYQEHMHNHIETTYAGGRTVVNGRAYDISFRAKWLAGNNLLNTRLYFNRAARSTALPMAQLNGTPGAQNSRHEVNIGPTFSQFGHQPIVPQPGQPVTVSAVVQDPDGVASAELWWSPNSGPWSNAPMAALPNGLYRAAIENQSTGVVQFFVRAVDGLGAAATFPAAGTNSGALYAIADGQANLPLAHNVRIILTPANVNLLHGFTNVMSNELLPCTVVYDERQVYYDMGVHLRGSQRGRYSDIRTGFHLTFQPDELFLGMHPVMLIDRSGAGDATANRQEEIVLKHILNRAGALPGTYSQICRVIAPRSAHNGPAQFFPRHEDVFIETAFDNGGDGTLFEMELIYYPTSANAAGYKNPQPDQVIGTDVTNMGDDKEIYRYNFMIKNHRDRDDYSRFIALAKAWSLSGTPLDTQTQLLMDVDQWMRAYALISLCSVGDMYTFGNNHNFFIYQRPDGKFVYFPWDMDFAFTRGGSGALVGDQNLAKVVNLPGNLRCLYAHMLDIIRVSFNTQYMAYWTDHYDNFAPGQSYAGSLTTIGQRVTFVQSTINGAGGNSPFRLNGTNVITTNNNLITLSGTAPVQIKTIKVNGIDYPVTWTTISAWTLRVPVDAATNVLIISGSDLYGNPVTNAPINVVVHYTGALRSAEGAIVINEVMYNPEVPGASYIELFNVSSNAFDLTGWRLNGLGFTFPSFVLPSRNFALLVEDPAAFVNAYGSVPGTVFAFPGRLDDDGETLTLIKPSPSPAQEVIVDKVKYEPVTPWPAAANTGGIALQVIDSTNDNARVSNWTDGQGWRFFSFSRTNTSTSPTRISFFFTDANGGDFYLDDLCFVEGSVPCAGSNYVSNGDFESQSTQPFVFGPLATNSAISTDVVHSGNASLHYIQDPGAAQLTTFFQDISPVSTGTVYTLSFWFLSNRGTNFRTRLSTFYDVTANVRLIRSTPGTNNLGTSPLVAYPNLWLNEIQPENVSGILDNSAEREPWIEIVNIGNDAVSLEGAFLSSAYSNLVRWPFPPGTMINPGEFKVVFADGESGESTPTELHTNFRLSPGAGSLVLSRDLAGTPQILDYINYTNVNPDLSYGSYPDGQPFHRREFINVTPRGTNDPTLPPAPIYINEWMASNTRSIVDTSDGGFDDWFELYNAGSEPVDLTGYRLTDSFGNTNQFTIPSGYVIPANGFLMVWADDDEEVNGTNFSELHANFQLARGGEVIALFERAPSDRLVHSVTFGEQTSDISQGFYPDATGLICAFAVVTPEAPNAPPTNCLPQLAPISTKYLYLGQSMNLQVSGTDPDLPAQTLRYSLLLAPTGAVIHSSSGLLSWTPAQAQLGTNRFFVQVTDNGTPPLSDSRNFIALVLARPAMTMSLGDPGQISLSISSAPGKTYRVEYTDDLTSGTWERLGDDMVASGNTLTITDSIGPDSQRFYRINIVD